MPTEYKGWPSLLYYHLIASGKHNISEVADRMGISASSLYKYAEGECNFPPDLTPKLYNATHEREFLDFLTRGTDQMPMPRPPARANGRPIEMETLDVTAVVGELAKLVTAALADGKLSEPEIRWIEQTIGLLHEEAEQVANKAREKA